MNPQDFKNLTTGHPNLTMTGYWAFSPCSSTAKLELDS